MGMVPSEKILSRASGDPEITFVGGARIENTTTRTAHLCGPKTKSRSVSRFGIVAGERPCCSDIPFSLV